MTKISVATRLSDSFVFADEMYDEDINADVAAGLDTDVAAEIDADVATRVDANGKLLK